MAKGQQRKNKEVKNRLRRFESIIFESDSYVLQLTASGKF